MRGHHRRRGDGHRRGPSKKAAEQEAARQALERSASSRPATGKSAPPICRRRHPCRSLGSTRVFLRSVRLRGFKSFPDAVEVRLEPGVAVVIGPNGSGKSNVSDAIVWAAGSLSPSELRAEKPDDVLFAGSAGRPSGGALRGRAAVRQHRGRRTAPLQRAVDRAPPHAGRRGPVPRQPRRRPADGRRRAARRRGPRQRHALADRTGSRGGGARLEPRGAASWWRRRPVSGASSGAGTAPS